MATNGSHADEGSTAKLARRLTFPNVAHADTTSTTSTTTSTTRALLHDLIAGGVAGSCGIIVGHPLDSLKVRMQMISGSGNAAPSFTTLLNSAKFGSVWKGIGAPLTMAAVINASIFLTYGGSTRVWDEYYYDPEKTKATSSFTKNAICGGVTGIVSSLIICPSEHVKTKLQTQKVSAKVSYRNSFHAAEHIFTNHGIVGLYRGFSATIARQVPGFIVYFPTYHRLKDYAIQNHFGTQYTLLASILSGGISGSVSWAIVYPVDLIKSRIQALPLGCSKKERSAVHVAKEVIRQHGWRALYRGLGITIMRAFPVNGIIFPTYELTLKALRSS
eukprot:CAMPEP_0201881380 /NCGR_PEP_ID=MMETSP0902-20130614/11701_1 /ASSEMBLY_ACC=CAM_ASM_000551 /TAXON_ID=420261 /ORGANISM="Thalassiosira antarctica, Strain CCMP982" /LENGTH=330 /DNA_ID=CAMNT_0048409575 /DNA_START=48 /DNA_END=1040 /DNA_ORIENTATION=+